MRMGAFGESPPLATPTTGAWLVALVLLPWPVAALLQRLIPSISRREAALVAYNLAAVSPNIYMAYVGCYTYWADEGAAVAHASAHGRLYAPLAPAASMISVCIAYELWNTLAAFALPEYRTAAYVGHHASTLCLALLCTAPFLHYYSLFFLGPPSVSSVLLGLVDIFRHTGLHSYLPTTNLVVRLLFALAFLATRSVMWPYVSACFWRDVGGVLAAGTSHSAWSCTVYLAANIFLTGLQLIWTVRIVRGLWKAIVGGGSKEE